MNQYILYGIISLILLALELVYFRVADHFNIIDRPNERSSHSSIVLRSGGIIFLLGILVWAAAVLCGCFGDYAVVSFNASKLLTVPPVGDLLVGKNRQVIESIERNADWKDSDWKFKTRGLIRGLVFRLTENHFFYKFFQWWCIDRKGKIQRTEHEKPSNVKTDLYKYRFAEWQSVILWKQLKQLDRIISKRKAVYAYYDKHINNPLIKKPIHNPDAVCCRYAVMTENRWAFYRACVDNGVDLDFSHCNLGCPESFKEELNGAKRVMNLPFFYHITDKEMKKVVKVVNSVRV